MIYFCPSKERKNEKNEWRKKYIYIRILYVIKGSVYNPIIGWMGLASCVMSADVDVI